MKCFERFLYEKINFVIVLQSVCGYGFPNNVKDHMVGVPPGFCEAQGFWSTECEEIKMAMIIFLIVTSVKSNCWGIPSMDQSSINSPNFPAHLYISYYCEIKLLCRSEACWSIQVPNCISLWEGYTDVPSAWSDKQQTSVYTSLSSTGGLQAIQ